MTVYEFIQQLAKYPPDTEIVQAFDWAPPIITDEYLDLEDGAALVLDNFKEFGPDGELVPRTLLAGHNITQPNEFLPLARI